MRYLLDTNTIVRYLNGRVPNIRMKIDAMTPQDLATAAIVVAELRYGAAKSNNPMKTIQAQDQFLNLIDLVDFDRNAAEIYGQIRADLEKKGTPIGPNDTLIGATAMANNLILVTHNTREFSRIVGLQYEDWE